MAREGEGQVGQVVALLAVDGVLPVEALLGADLLVEQLGEGGGEREQRSARVEDGAGAFDLGRLVAEGDGLEVDLPVGLAAEGDLGQLAAEVGPVDAAECGQGVVAFGVGVAEVEREDGLVDQVLVDHVVEGWYDLVDADAVVAQAEDAVEAGKGEGETGLLSDFAEVLLLNLEVAYLNCVLRDESLDATRSVPDLEV